MSKKQFAMTANDADGNQVRIFGERVRRVNHAGAKVILSIEKDGTMEEFAKFVMGSGLTSKHSEIMQELRAYNENIDGRLATFAGNLLTNS